jgi:hypothetical protein
MVYNNDVEKVVIFTYKYDTYIITVDYSIRDSLLKSITVME